MLPDPGDFLLEVFVRLAERIIEHIAESIDLSFMLEWLARIRERVVACLIAAVARIWRRRK